MRRTRSLLTVVALAAATLTAALGSAPTAGAAPSSCTPNRLIVARGTLEPGTLGIIVGDPLKAALERRAPGTFTGPSQLRV